MTMVRPAFFKRIFDYRLPQTATAPFCPSEVAGSVPVLKNVSVFRRFLAYAGTGMVIAIGYIDPGNWATDIEAGSRFGFSLLNVILISSLIAMLLQTLCVRLGVVSGKDLARLCRENFSRPTGLGLWFLAELAIIACDLAEVLGTALAFKLLLHLPLSYGVLLTAFDTVIVLVLQGKGVRRVEAIVLAFAATVAGCYAVELALASPHWNEVANGFSLGSFPVHSHEAWYVAIGILGATVMPHNLYLHTSLVQTRAEGKNRAEKAEAIRFGQWDTWASLSLAFVVNAAILILAGAVFHRAGQTQIADIEQAHKLLAPLVGSSLAPILFAIALLAAGQSSTLTGTIAGQAVMDGFLDLKIPCWQRRLITRALALAPAWIGVVWLGDGAVGRLLVGSQVALSLQLPFAVVPLILFASSQKVMGAEKISKIFQATSWLACAAIVAANGWFLLELFR